jgi:uncharacterized protein YkwD
MSGALLLLCPLLSLGQPAGPAQGKVDTARAAAVLKLANQFRQTEGVLPLTTDDALTRAAQKHADNMARQESASHVLDGKGPGERIDAEKYAYTRFGENIAFVAGGPFANAAGFAMRFWKQSPVHRKNLVGEAFTHTGIGVARAASGRWYFCQVFAAPRAAD